jgi:hypothetical protein
MKCFSGEDLSQNCGSFSVVVVDCELLLVCALWPGLSSDEGACGLKREGGRRGVGRMRGVRCRAKQRRVLSGKFFYRQQLLFCPWL